VYKRHHIIMKNHDPITGISLTLNEIVQQRF